MSDHDAQVQEILGVNKSHTQVTKTIVRKLSYNNAHIFQNLLNKENWYEEQYINLW